MHENATTNVVANANVDTNEVYVPTYFLMHICFNFINIQNANYAVTKEENDTFGKNDILWTGLRNTSFLVLFAPRWCDSSESHR